MVSIPLLIADASEILLGALLQPTWGIYTAQGQPVIQPASFITSAFVSQVQPLSAVANLLGLSGILPVSASTVEFDFRQDWPISTAPQEQGAFQAYDKVTLPYDVRLRLASGGSTSTRQSFLQACLAIANSLQLFNVVTPEMSFIGVNCNHIDWKRTARHGNTLITVDLGFIQIPQVSSLTPINTAIPGNSGQQALGNVAPQSLSSPQALALAGGTAPM